VVAERRAVKSAVESPYRIMSLSNAPTTNR
jgi:hypothetical protein